MQHFGWSWTWGSLQLQQKVEQNLNSWKPMKHNSMWFCSTKCPCNTKLLEFWDHSTNVSLWSFSNGLEQARHFQKLEVGNAQNFCHLSILLIINNLVGHIYTKFRCSFWWYCQVDFLHNAQDERQLFLRQSNWGSFFCKTKTVQLSWHNPDQVVRCNLCNKQTSNSTPKPKKSYEYKIFWRIFIRRILIHTHISYKVTYRGGGHNI